MHLGKIRPLFILSHQGRLALEVLGRDPWVFGAGRTDGSHFGLARLEASV
jgi:hypothetical protein